jgi:hypothetical protein
MYQAARWGALTTFPLGTMPWLHIMPWWTYQQSRWCVCPPTYVGSLSCSDSGGRHSIRPTRSRCPRLWKPLPAIASAHAGTDRNRQVPALLLSESGPGNTKPSAVSVDQAVRECHGPGKFDVRGQVLPPGFSVPGCRVWAWCPDLVVARSATDHAGAVGHSGGRAC